MSTMHDMGSIQGTKITGTEFRTVGVFCFCIFVVFLVYYLFHFPVSFQYLVVVFVFKNLIQYPSKKSFRAVPVISNGLKVQHTAVLLLCKAGVL